VEGLVQGLAGTTAILSPRAIHGLHGVAVSGPGLTTTSSGWSATTASTDGFT
jgi:hypothetical protein